MEYRLALAKIEHVGKNISTNKQELTQTTITPQRERDPFGPTRTVGLHLMTALYIFQKSLIVRSEGKQ
jgi:hypothetical protein